MALENYVRMIWDIGSGPTQNVVSIQTSDDTIRVAGDHRRKYLEGMAVFIAGSGAGNNGSKTILSNSTYDGTNTVIPIATNLVDEGAVPTIQQPAKFIEFEWARIKLDVSEPAHIARTRLGIVKRTIPVNAASKKRYINGFTIVPIAGDCLLVSNGNVALADVLYAECFDDDTEFIVKLYESNYDSEGTERILKRYWKGFPDFRDGQDLLGSLVSIDDDTPTFSITFSCHEDGTFTYVGATGDLTSRTRP